MKIEVVSMSVIIYLLFCVLVAFFASHRGRSPILWGIISLLVSPLITVIVLAVLKDLTTEQRLEQTNLEADRLKERVAVSEQELHHRMDHMEQRMDHLDGHTASQIEGDRHEALQQGETMTCSQCGEVIPAGASFCPHCGAKLQREESV
jgi:hypothetical protein